MSAHEAVIGLEVHVELLTASKMFCGCANRFGAPPNTLTCPVCLGLPGSLPVTNARAVELGIKAGLALGCDIRTVNSFDRKNYFYPDMPKNYQVSQFAAPLAVAGALEPAGGPRVGIRRAHLEEDVGKLMHPEGAAYSLVDFNRAGVPLLEIVTEPDIRTPEQAQAFLEALRSILLYIEASDCNMEEGSLRCDANISLRPRGATELGTKVEVKNMNSFRAVRLALAREVERQEAILSGRKSGRLVQETRLWDEKSGRTLPMRSKEEAQDYRYFPEPDLPPMNADAAMVDRARASLVELPAARAARFEAEYRLPAYDARVLTADRALADYFEAAVAACPAPKAVANWVMTEVLSLLREGGLPPAKLRLTPAFLGEIVHLVEEKKITATTGKEVLRETAATGAAPAALVSEKGLAQISGTAELGALVAAVLAENEGPVADYRRGKKNALGFLVGQVMRRSGGKANPGVARQLLTGKLEEQ